ncbi:DUF354 domain-containing protein [Methanoregula sp.]|uniref:DUF354 domain-containing protein n=1 Tax=Methanoregula sp. TaxID=2052170 RepID=UPI0026199B1E|nr:DUF354 domain-containing protein [Methanoregula sp.]MDD5141897.1 DUF354 domain-containing protein [Methanoregula sp.]
MKILISVNHPAHVHLFKNFIWKMQEKGHEFLIVARDKDKTINLLDIYGFKYVLTGKAETTPLGYLKEMIKRTRQFYSLIGKFHPHIILTQMDPSPGLAATLRRVPYICLADSEPAKIILYSTMPLTQAVLTPESFRMNLGKKQIVYAGYKELAYLHPNIFKPDVSILDELGVQNGEPFIILRFVSWGAHHDIGKKGIQDKLELVKKLEKFGRIFISSEATLDENLKKYELTVSSEKMHDVLYYARLFFCDSQTMATEAAILGTPTVRCNSFVGTKDMGNFIELEEKYGLVYNFSDENAAINCAISFLNNPNIKNEWAKKLKILLGDKIDVTAFLVWFIEAYPQSVVEIRENPDLQSFWGHVTGETL